MNASYEKNAEFHSNNDIFEQYFQNQKAVANPWLAVLDRVLAVLATLVLSLSRARERGRLRVCGVAVSLVGLVGLVGAMESGTVSLWLGLLLSAPLVAVELLCLRPHKK